MSSVKVEPIAGPFTLGEGPHWDESSKSLYFVDIDGKAICKYNSTDGGIKKCQLDRLVGFVLPVDGKPNHFLIGYGNDFAILQWDGESTEPQAVTIYLKTDPPNDNRINDGKSDPNGRVWAGSMCPVKINGEWQKSLCSLFSLEKSSAGEPELKTRISKVHLSNGLAWSLDHKTFYYIDSLLNNVRSWDYNISTGDIENEQVVYEHSGAGIPDGMTIDAEGKLWVSLFQGGKVIRVDPATKSLLSSVNIPAYLTTSVAWGGTNYDELYVTSANIAPLIPEDKRVEYKFNGYVFKVTGLGVKGLPAVNAKPVLK